MNIKPIGTLVLVESDAPETQTASGIIIPDSAQDKPQSGTVVAAGPGTHDHIMQCHKGHKVLYGKNAGIEHKVGDKTYLILDEKDPKQLFAIIE